MRQDGEEAYRLAKVSAQNRGDYRFAGAYHYAEQCAIEDRRRKRSEWRLWKEDFWSSNNAALT
jgi:hypothetical protein